MTKFDLLASLHIDTLELHLMDVQRTLHAIAQSSPSPLGEPLQRMIKAPGKRIRPSLVIASVLANNRPIDDRVISLATAIECIHLGTLIHDDSIDDSKTRRGIATIAAKEGQDIALLCGDYLLAEATKQAARVSPEAAQLTAAVIQEMCIGEGMELATQHDVQRSLDDYVETIRLKTARLIAAACMIGNLQSGEMRHLLSSFDIFGESFGMAFQLIDDVFDFIADASVLGKEPGSDVASGIYTYPVIRALQHDPTLAALLQPDSLHSKGINPIIAALVRNNTFNDTMELARDYADKAHNSLMGSNDIVTKLKNAPLAYVTWSYQTVAEQLSKNPV